MRVQDFNKANVWYVTSSDGKRLKRIWEINSPDVLMSFRVCVAKLSVFYTDNTRWHVKMHLFA